MYKDNFDVVFMVDEINYTDEELSAICEKIYYVSKAVFNASANVTVRVYGLNGKNKQTGCDFYGRTDNVNGLEGILKKVSHTELTADDLVDISRATSISEAIDYVALSYIISNIDDDQFKDNFNFEMNFSEAVKKASELGIAFDHEEFGFIFFDADRTNCNIKGFETLFSIGSNSYNIKQSIVSNVAGIENKDEYKYSYARVLFDETEGMNFDIAANREVFVENVLNYIYGKVPTEAGAYDAIIATGYSTVVLDKPLTEHDMELAEKRFDDPEYVFSDEEVKNCADTDRDGLFDFEEVMFYIYGNPVISINEYDEVTLPTVGEILGETQDGKTNLFNAFHKMAYVKAGLKKSEQMYGYCFEEFKKLSVLPIYSDPVHVDGDNDGVNDADELKMENKNPLLLDNVRVLYNEKIKEEADAEKYLNAVYKVAGGKKMVDYMMEDHYDTSKKIDVNVISDEWWDMYCTHFNSYILDGYSFGKNITKEIHFFRNKLNRAPKTLDELINESEKWDLLGLEASQYHMYDTEACYDNEEGVYKGEYNLKFVSKDGKYEAVYNYKKELLTEYNDPVNMGTYNYASPNDPVNHFMFDVKPYSNEWYFVLLGAQGWFNVPGVDIDCNARKKNVNKYNNNNTAKGWRSDWEEKMR